MAFRCYFCHLHSLHAMELMSGMGQLSHRMKTFAKELIRPRYLVPPGPGSGSRQLIKR